MSQEIARNAMTRMNLHPIAVAVHGTTLHADMQSLANADHEVEQKKYMENRRAELCAAYGFNNAQVQDKPFAFANGVAIIPFSGTMINRFGSSYGWVTGYNFIRRQLAQALADDDVKMIVGDFNTYGGEAAGCFETSNLIFQARGQKPMVAVIDSNCYSAGYALASAFDKVYCTPSGGAGSIGVVSMHVNMGKLLDAIGYEITFIQFGDHKTDGHPYGKLPDEVKSRLQAGINKLGKSFCELVAQNRGIDYKAVVDTQALCYNADEALSLGLIDAIATPNEAVKAFYDDLSGSASETEEEDEMSTQTDTGTKATVQPDAAAQAATAAAAATAQAAAVKAAVAADRTRQQAILGCDEAAGKSKLANHIAFNTEMSVDEAKTMLGLSGLETAAPAAAAPNALEAAMDAHKTPNVGADAAANEQSPDASAASAILADQQKVTGLKVVK